MLDPLDKMIEAMGLPFARYADDFLIVTKTKAEALAAMAAVEEYVEGRLKLLVNREKSKVAPLAYAESLQWDQWIRRRVRLCHWKDWKVPRKRRRMLIRLGVPPDEVRKASRSRKGYWRMSRNSLVAMALNNDYLKRKGVPSMRDLWVRFKYGEQAQV